MTSDAGNPRKPLLIFDLDGTLMDTRRDIATAVNLMRKHYGLAPLPMDTVTSYVGDGIHVLVRRSLADAPGTDLDDATRVCRLHYGEHLTDETTLYPGVRDGLEALRDAGFALAMVSNKPKEPCVRLLEHFRIAHLFDCVLGGGDTEKPKPHPDPLLFALRAADADPAASWMIGDHKTDLEAARRAGLRSIFLTHGMGETGEEHPTHVFHSFHDVTGFFLRRKAPTP